MKFSTVKEMEETLKKIKSKKELSQDISFRSQGEEIFLEFIGEGPRQNLKDAIWIGRETSDNLRVSFDDNGGDSINILEYSLNRDQYDAS